MLNRSAALTLVPRSPARADVARQQTLKTAIRCAGIGLHSGAQVEMVLMPAEPNSGIVFRRVDQTPVLDIPASWQNVVDTRLCTRIGLPSGPSVSTVEHLMAALAGSEIDNAIIEIDGPEVPIMDGSAAPFVFLIECAGTVEQPAARRAIKVLRDVEAGSGPRTARLSSAPVSSVSFDIDFDSPVIRQQQAEMRLGAGTFKTEISRARTFGFLHEIDQLRAAGLARGGSLDNAVVVSSEGVMNEGGLRYDDEFVRHKILDAVGDLYLAGGPILGHFHGCRAGHQLHHAVLATLFAHQDNWCWVELPVQPATAIAEKSLAIA